MPFLQASLYVAQAYGCGAYGQNAYQQCEETLQAGGQAQTGQVPADQLQKTATPEESKGFLEPQAMVGQPPQTTQFEPSPAADFSLGLLLLASFLIALGIALIILFVKRWRRRKLDQFPPSNTFPPQT